MPVTADIYYSETGKENLSSPPLLLIHGAGSSHLSWPAEIRRIKGFRILSLDLPGHGSSGGSAEQCISEYARRLSHFMETLGNLQGNPDRAIPWAEQLSFNKPLTTPRTLPELS